MRLKFIIENKIRLYKNISPKGTPKVPKTKEILPFLRYLL